MKRIIIFTFLLSLFATHTLLGENNITKEAQEAYDKGNYKKAIELYESEVKVFRDKGLESAHLYYNLGNAHFRDGAVAKARLNYERALLLDPGDRDIRHNIKFIENNMKDKIPVSNTFFLNTWFTAVQDLFPSNTWATIGVVCFIAFIFCFGVFLFTGKQLYKKIVFYGAIVFLLIVILSNIFAFRQRSSIENRDNGIIMYSSVQLFSAPDMKSKSIQELNEGTKVKIKKEDPSWLEIELSSGQIGWIQRKNVEKI